MKLCFMELVETLRNEIQVWGSCIMVAKLIWGNLLGSGLVPPYIV